MYTCKQITKRQSKQIRRYKCTWTHTLWIYTEQYYKEQQIPLLYILTAILTGRLQRCLGTIPEYLAEELKWGRGCPGREGREPPCGGGGGGWAEIRPGSDRPPRSDDYRLSAMGMQHMARLRVAPLGDVLSRPLESESVCHWFTALGNFMF